MRKPGSPHSAAGGGCAEGVWRLLTSAEPKGLARVGRLDFGDDVQMLCVDDQILPRAVHAARAPPLREGPAPALHSLASDQRSMSEVSETKRTGTPPDQRRDASASALSTAAAAWQACSRGTWTRSSSCRQRTIRASRCRVVARTVAAEVDVAYWARADQYGIRAFVVVDSLPIKFEIVNEGRVAFDVPGGQHQRQAGNQ